MLNAYASSIIRGEPFNLSSYAGSIEIKKAVLPDIIKLITIAADSIVHKLLALQQTGQGGSTAVPEPSNPNKVEPERPANITPILGQAEVILARAHFSHMTACTGLAPHGEPYSRYYVVARISWAGTVKTVEELSGKLVSSPTYHERIVAMIQEMK